MLNSVIAFIKNIDPGLMLGYLLFIIILIIGGTIAYRIGIEKIRRVHYNIVPTDKRKKYKSRCRNILLICLFVGGSIGMPIIKAGGDFTFLKMNELSGHGVKYLKTTDHTGNYENIQQNGKKDQQGINDANKGK